MRTEAFWFSFLCLHEYGGAKAACALSFLRLDQLQSAVALHPFAAAVLHQLLQLDLALVDGRDHAEVLAHVVALVDAVEVGTRLDQREGLLLLRDGAEHLDRFEREGLKGLLDALLVLGELALAAGG